MSLTSEWGGLVGDPPVEPFPPCPPVDRDGQVCFTNGENQARSTDGFAGMVRRSAWGRSARLLGRGAQQGRWGPLPFGSAAKRLRGGYKRASWRWLANHWIVLARPSSKV